MWDNREWPWLIRDEGKRKTVVEEDTTLAKVEQIKRKGGGGVASSEPLLQSSCLDAVIGWKQLVLKKNGTRSRKTEETTTNNLTLLLNAILFHSSSFQPFIFLCFLPSICGLEMHKKNKLISLWSKCLIYNYIRVPCISLHSISTRARIVCFFLWSRALLIFTQAASGKYIFQNGSGASGKRAEQKRIFHFAQTNAKLRFADLHEDARALVYLCLPGNVGNGLPSQVKCRKSTKKMEKENKGE